MRYICQECREKIPEGKEVVFNGLKYHKECAKIKQERTELHELICDIFNFKAPGPRVHRQIKSYIEKGYTYEGIANSLKYFYYVKRNSTAKSNEGIGIVPYVYEEANDYFKRFNYKVDQIGKKGAWILGNEQVRKVTIREAPKVIEEVYNLEEL